MSEGAVRLGARFADSMEGQIEGGWREGRQGREVRGQESAPRLGGMLTGTACCIAAKTCSP